LHLKCDGVGVWVLSLLAVWGFAFAPLFSPLDASMLSSTLGFFHSLRIEALHDDGTKEWRTQEGTRNAGMGMWLSPVQRTLAVDYWR
jgi:hypothetical protein